MKTRARLLLAALATCAGALAAAAGSPVPPLARDEISATQLAEWIHARRPGLVVLDARPAESMQRGRLPGARAVAEFEGDAGATVVLYGDRRAEEVPTWRGPALRVLRLRGGIEAWDRDVLFPVLRADASEAQRREFEPRARLSRYFGGSPRVLDPGAKASRVRSRRGC